MPLADADAYRLYMRRFMRGWRARKQLARVQQEKSALISQMADLALTFRPGPTETRPSGVPAQSPEPQRWRDPSAPVANLQSPPCLIDFKPAPFGTGFSNTTKWR
jgi:hypothetical protein